MKEKLTAVLLSLLLCGGLHAGLGIVLPENPSRYETMAAGELSEHLTLATGKTYPVSRGVVRETRNIFIGSHPKIQELLKGLRSFRKEEWLVQAFGNDTLILTGGTPRGILYAVYEFLENELGVLWLDEWSTHVPRRQEITWNVGLKYSGEPSFACRGVYAYFGADRALRHRFYARNRQNHFHDEKFRSGEAWDRGVSPVIGSPRSCHTFYNYTQNWDKSKDALFSWSAQAQKHLRATSAYGPGQVCLSNPETVRLFAEQLRKYIQADIQYSGKEQAPEIYVISPNDNISYCECEQCKAGVRKYGGQTGLLLRFVNALAENIEKDYPQIRLMTTAYVSTKDLPAGIVPHKNVMIQIALLGSEFSGERRDTHRAYTHPVNRESAEIIRKWQKIAPIAVWDYWCLNLNRGLYPATNTVNLADSLHFYKRNNVKFVFAECPDAHQASFHALRLYVGLRMMCKENLDVRQEIIRFMNAYYGKAAPMLLAYHDELQKRNSEVQGSLCDLPLSRRTDLDDAFFHKAEDFLTRAEAAEKDNPVILERIGREWIPVLRARLDKRAMLEKLPQEKQREIARRLLQLETAAIRKYLPEIKQKTELNLLNMYIRGILADIPALRGFEKKDVIADYAWPVLSGHRQTSVFDDPDAAGGKAVGMTGREGRDEQERKHCQENRGISCGVYDFHNRVSLAMGNIPPQAVPQDEKYHWYRVGRFELAAKSFLWMHWTWLSQQQLGGVYDDSGLNNHVDVYASIKVSGPNYVKGSMKANVYAIDRVVVCRSTNQPDPSMTPLPDELRGRKCMFEISGLNLGKFQRIQAVYDPDSATRTALKLGSQTTHAKQQLMLGMYDRNRKKVTARIQVNPIPADEKYHPYSLGVMTVPEAGYIFAHASCLLRVDLHQLYSKLDAGKKYEIVLMVKAEGPAYVPGSVRENAVSLSQIFLLEPKNH